MPYIKHERITPEEALELTDTPKEHIKVGLYKQDVFVWGELRSNMTVNSIEKYKDEDYESNYIYEGCIDWNAQRYWVKWDSELKRWDNC